MVYLHGHPTNQRANTGDTHATPKLYDSVVKEMSLFRKNGENRVAFAFAVLTITYVILTILAITAFLICQIKRKKY